MCTTKSPLHVLLLGALLSVSFLMMGCDSGGDDDDNGNGNNTGSFSAQLDGEGLDESLSGIAWFAAGEDPETGEEGFFLWMSPSAQQTSTTLWFATYDARPDEGTYPLIDLNVDDPTEALDGTFAAWLTHEGAYYAGTEGSITIENSSSNRVSGDFSFTAMGFSSTDPEGFEVTIEGTFNALGTSVGIPVPF